jgi:hypothetical protein
VKAAHLVLVRAQLMAALLYILGNVALQLLPLQLDAAGQLVEAWGPRSRIGL